MSTLLEEASIQSLRKFQDPAVVVSLRRPADVLVDAASSTPAGTLRKAAWDVKVINALGNDHFQSTLEAPLAAADRYREESMEHQSTAQQCADSGIKYEPLVFTAQGGI